MAGPVSSNAHACTPAAARILLGIVLLGMLVRAAHLLEQPTFPEFHRPEVDAYYYDLGARQIESGDWQLGHEPLRMSPGYFYALGSIYTLFGHGPWAPRIVQLMLGLALIVLVWDATRTWLGRRWAPWPALAAALYGPFVYFEGHLLAESMAAFCVALLTWALVRAARASELRIWHWAGLGLCLGMCVVLRPNALLLALPIAYLALHHCGMRVQSLLPALAAIGLGCALMIAPITVRNVIASGEPVLLTAHGGLNLYVGNAPGATGTYRVPPEVAVPGGPQEQYRAFHTYAERALGRALSAREADAFWMARTAEAVGREPAAWLRLMLRKLHLFWNGRELHNVYDYEFARMVGVVLGAPLVQFAFIAPFALLGMLVLLVRPGVDRVLGLLLASSCASVVLAFVTDRYRLPSVGPALLCGVGLVHAVTTDVRQRRSLRLALYAGLFAAACVVAVPVRVNKKIDQKYFKYASAWLDLGHPGHAAWGLQHALQANPRFLPAHEKLAELYARVGDHEALRAELQRWDHAARSTGNAADLAAVRAAEQRWLPSAAP